jgi:L-lactate utilization protein LutC
MSQVISLRLDDDVIAKLKALKIDDENLHATAKRILLEALGMPVNDRKHDVNNDERINELIDSKVAYLATAMNQVKHELEDRITSLENEIEAFKISTSSPATSEAITCTHCGSQNTIKHSGNRRKCKDCGKTFTPK